MVLVLRLGISVFIDTAPAAKPLSWQQHYGCHFVSFLNSNSNSHANWNYVSFPLNLTQFSVILTWLTLTRIAQFSANLN